jgi:hypothetical protein
MILTLFESVQRAYTRPEQIVSGDWDTVAEFLMTPVEAQTKESVPLFNLWEFDPCGEPGRRRIYRSGLPTEDYETIPGTIRRCRANARALHGLVLDYDSSVTFDQAQAEFARVGLECVIYTTFRNSDQQNKFRVVLPFSEPLTLGQVTAKKPDMAQVFPHVDHASFSESQCFYLHSGPVRRAERLTGVRLDPKEFRDTEVPVPATVTRPTQTNTGDNDRYRALLIESLLTCHGLHYANEGSRLGVLTLVALCKSAGITEAEYDVICHNMAAPDSSLQDPGRRLSAWLGWQPHSGITAQVREEFIRTYGGQSRFPQLKNRWLETRMNLLNKYKEKP